MADIVLKDRNGNDEIYEGVKRVKFNTTDGGTQTFMEGETTTVTIEPDFSEGNMTVTPEEGMFFSEVAVKKPDALIPGNIAKDINIAGIVGTLEGGGENELQLLVDGANGREWEVNRIGRLMFYSNSTLTSETFLNASTIGNSAFENCKILSAAFPVCTMVGGYAFSGCSKINSVSLPVCKSIIGYAFFSCIALKQVELPECEYVGVNAFGGCYNITNIDLPKCKSIETSAFYGCNKLQELSVSECSIISSYAFSGCNSLKTIYAPKCSSLGTYLFYSCSNLSNITFGSGAILTSLMNLSGIASNKLLTIDGLAGISQSAFRSCNMSGLSLLKTGVFSSSAFAYCSNLKQVYNNLAFFWTNQFYNCSNLIRVISPNLRHVGTNAFRNCTSLKYFSGQYVSYISGAAFMSCKNLSVILLSSYSSLTSTLGMAFSSTPLVDSSYLGYYGSIYVPESCLSLYLADSYWSSYYDRFTVTTPEIEALCEWEDL